METKQYNGWTNYETWNVALWIDNEEGSHRYWRAQAQECFEEAGADKTFSRSENARMALADMLQVQIKDAAPELEGCYADLLGAALSEVNWQEIANGQLEGAEAEGEDEEGNTITETYEMDS